jgi:hypothetical protein
MHQSETAANESADRPPGHIALRVAAVFASHVVVGFALYAGAAVYHWGIDLYGAFYLPYLLALLGYWIALQPSAWFQLHGAVRILACFLFAFVSFFAYALVAFNIWGT